MALSMDKMGGFMGNLNVVSQTRQSDKIKMIDIADMVDSKDNFFEINKIEELAAAIHGQGGVKDNLIVRPLEDGKYEIISGHRRKAAVKYLIDNGEKISTKLPCLVQNYDDDDSMKLDLILMNVTSRQLSDSELYKSYEMLTEIFQQKKEKGEKFGKLRDNLANMLGVSSSQIGKLQNIDKHGTSEVKEAIKSGDLSVSTANQLSRLPEEEQKEVLKNTEKKEIKHKDVKKRVDKKVDTCVNFSEENESNEEADISENDYTEKENEDDNIIEFIKTNKIFLTSLLSKYADKIDSSYDRDIISKFADIISKV